MEKRRDIRNFYIDEEFIPVWNEFKKICEREDESISQKIRSFVARYVTIHQEGNPQLRLESFVGKVSKSCYTCEGHFPFLHRVKFVSGLVASVCTSCLEEHKKRGVVKKIL